MHKTPVTAAMLVGLFLAANTVWGREARTMLPTKQYCSVFMQPWEPRKRYSWPDEQVTLTVKILSGLKSSVYILKDDKLVSFGGAAFSNNKL